MTLKTEADDSTSQMAPPTVGLFAGVLAVLAAAILGYQFGPVVGAVAAVALLALYGLAYYLSLSQ